MEPGSKKSFLPAVGVEVVIIAVLVILIVVTFNYFNIIPFSIPFLPHQGSSKTTNSQNAKLATFKFARNPKCENLPAGIVMPKITTSTASASLQKYLGVWNGKWNDQIPTAIIFTNMGQYGANAVYFYNGQAQNIGTVYEINNNKLTSLDKNLSWEINGDTLSGTFYVNGKPTATTVMKKCNL